MKKKLKQVNTNQVGFTFTREEREIYGLEIDKVYDLSEIVQIGSETLPGRKE